MKKLLVFAVIAVTFASCANSDTKTVEEVTSTDSALVVTPDSTLVVTDSTVTTTVTVDSTKK